jgi:hypothetical protein
VLAGSRATLKGKGPEDGIEKIALELSKPADVLRAPSGPLGAGLRNELRKETLPHRLGIGEAPGL